MKLTKLQRAKLTVKIDELEREKKVLLEQLMAKQKFHTDAWATYGSELCAGEMLDDELKISNQIRDVERQIKLFQDFLTDESSRKSVGPIRKQIQDLESEKSKSDEKKKKFEQDLADMQAISEVLN